MSECLVKPNNNNKLLINTGSTTIKRDRGHAVAIHDDTCSSSLLTRERQLTEERTCSLVVRLERCRSTRSCLNQDLDCCRLTWYGLVSYAETWIWSIKHRHWSHEKASRLFVGLPSYLLESAVLVRLLYLDQWSNYYQCTRKCERESRTLDLCNLAELTDYSSMYMSGHLY